MRLVTVLGSRLPSTVLRPETGHGQRDWTHMAGDWAHMARGLLWWSVLILWRLSDNNAWPQLRWYWTNSLYYVHSYDIHSEALPRFNALLWLLHCFRLWPDHGRAMSNWTVYDWSVIAVIFSDWRHFIRYRLAPSVWCYHWLLLALPVVTRERSMLNCGYLGYLDHYHHVSFIKHKEPVRVLFVHRELKEIGIRPRWTRCEIGFMKLVNGH